MSEGKRGKARIALLERRIWRLARRIWPFWCPVFPALHVTHSMGTEDRVALDSMSARSKLVAEDTRDRVDGSHERVAQEPSLHPYLPPSCSSSLPFVLRQRL